MNTTEDSQQTFSFDPNMWLFATVLSVSIGGFVAFSAGFQFHWSNSILGIVLSFATTLFSFVAAHVVGIRSHARDQFSRWFPWLLAASGIGWTISLLILYPLTGLGDGSFVLWKLDVIAGIMGFAGGGVIALPPGIFLSLAYWWLIRPYSGARLLFMNNVLGWFYGIGLASACFRMLLPFIVQPIF